MDVGHRTFLQTKPHLKSRTQRMKLYLSLGAGMYVVKGRGIFAGQPRLRTRMKDGHLLL